MQLTEEQIKFLDKVCYVNRLRVRGYKWKLNSDGKVDVDGSVIITNLNLTEIPVKFGRVEGWFRCANNNLTTLKNCPDYVSEEFCCSGNNLTNYFKSIKEDEFPLWKSLNLGDILEEYPFLVNIMNKYFDKDDLKIYINEYPLTKLYLE